METEAESGLQIKIQRLLEHKILLDQEYTKVCASEAQEETDKLLKLRSNLFVPSPTYESARIFLDHWRQRKKNPGIFEKPPRFDVFQCFILDEATLRANRGTVGTLFDCIRSAYSYKLDLGMARRGTSFRREIGRAHV